MGVPAFGLSRAVIKRGAQCGQGEPKVLLLPRIPSLLAIHVSQVTFSARRTSSRQRRPVIAQRSKGSSSSTNRGNVFAGPIFTELV